VCVLVFLAQVSHVSVLICFRFGETLCDLPSGETCRTEELQACVEEDSIVPTTSRANVCPQWVSVEQISPLPRRSEQPKKRRGNTMEATILTASPFKDSLTARVEMKKSKLEQKQKRQKSSLTATERTGKRQKTKTKDTKGMRKRKAGGPKRTESKGSTKLKLTECQGNSTRCLVCGETHEEDWIQCSKCSNWVHEACADIQNALYYYCDNCVNN